MTASTTSSSTLADFSDQLADAAERSARSIVAVHARPRIASTGVHWREGLIVTTAATVRRESGITVTIADGRSVPADLVGGDAAADLAVLRIDAEQLGDTAAAPPASLGDSASLRPGHLVMAIARLDAAGHRLSLGAVSAVGGPWRSWKGGEYSRQLRSTVTLYPGFGGGPLVDVHGRVHGINSGGISRQFATTIPVADVEQVIAHVLQNGFVPRGWIGAAMQSVAMPAMAAEALRSAAPPASDTAGAHTPGAHDTALLVMEMVADGPAATAGLLVGDIVLSIDGRRVRQPDDVLRTLGTEAVGRTIELALWRGGAAASVQVLVGARPQSRARRDR
jgi:S1-C subfamily serine protease